jgi:hypothetical protein
MKTKILLLLTIAPFLMSCESSDETSTASITKADLIGTWNLTKQTIEDGSINLTTQGQTISATYSVFMKDINFTYTFSENPDKLTLEGNYTQVYTTSFSGQNTTEEELISTNSPMVIDWSLTENTVVISEINGYPTTMNIVDFSSNYIKIMGEIDQTETDSGGTLTQKATIIIELER